ncbi:MAG: HEPN domain-containing protein [Chloroflexi bacterium]|nr:HEPN domain-containing protein [Chloroflexota bacterium]
MQTEDNDLNAKRAKDWLAQAERDLQHAQHSLDAGDYEWACFAAHQASEKALESGISGIGDQVIVGHSLREMMLELKHTLPVPDSLLNMARVLDRHYIPSRYPDAHPAGAPFEFYTKKEADQAINYANKVIGFCKSRLS